jgi:hypothetical protein
MKIFLKNVTHNNYWVNNNNIIDSDFDQEDVYEQAEIDDMFNGTSPQLTSDPEDGNNDEVDSDDGDPTLPGARY